MAAVAGNYVDAPSMASRPRVPLANAPHLANSPYRGPNGKRTRSTLDGVRDPEDQPLPPKKKQMLETGTQPLRRAEPIVLDQNESAANVFAGKPESLAHNSFAKRLMSVREPVKGTQASRAIERAAAEKPEKSASSDSLQQWRRHYRRIFPTFVFFFESLPSDVAYKAAKQVAKLGARDEKFFSKAVTHVVTTRQVPPDPHAASKTINPSLLEKNPDNATLSHGQQRGRSILDAASQRRSQNNQSGDILHKAREMDMKIWALEKFERMMNSLFAEDQDEGDARPTRASKSAKETDLRQLVKNERNGPTSALQEVIPFKGYYIYIHDIDERVKPVLVRDYPKVDVHQAEWPRFHSVSSGRCPFVEEPLETPEQRRRREERVKRRKETLEREEQQRKVATELAETNIAQRTRSATRSPSKAPLQEAPDASVNRMAKPPVPTNSFEAPKLRTQTSGNIDSMPPMLGSARANFHGLSRNHGGEPLASGMQRNNVTSAIRSQMISSNAAAPGAARAGISKEMHHLQRRVLEKHSGLSTNSMPSSYMNDVRAAINNENGKQSRPKSNKSLVTIAEDEALSDVERQPEQQAAMKETRASKKRKQPHHVKRDPKPGYCENCRDKYDDFYEHIESKQHQKFACADENFCELDELLKELERA